jgi:two-component system sensor histidine kinase UhpB
MGGGVPGSLVGRGPTVLPASPPSPLIDVSAGRDRTLLWRGFVANAAVLVAATLLLVISPLTVSFPIVLAELAALACGLAAMLALNIVTLRRAFRPHLGSLELERRDSARRARAAGERERRRIARELHDELGQALTAVVLQLDRAATSAEVAEARESVRASLDEMRGIAQRLRPEVLDDLGLASALAALTNDLARRTGVLVRRDIAPDMPQLAPDEELVVYRVAQEALTNVVRHAGAWDARLVLAVRDGRVELEVGDEGSGFDPRQAADGAGLLGMRERALLIGARLDVESAEGEGTAVRLKLP